MNAASTTVPVPTLLLGFPAPLRHQLVDALAGLVEDLQASPQAADDRAPALVCLGPELPGSQAATWLEHSLPPPAVTSAVGTSAVGTSAVGQPLVLVLAGGDDLSLFQPWLDADQLYYLSPGPPPPAQLTALLRSAAQHCRAATRMAAGMAPSAALSGPPATGLTQPAVQQALRRLGLQDDPGDGAELLSEAVRESVRADGGVCWLHDTRDQSLWTRDSSSGGERRHSASVGLTSFVLRSGLALSLRRSSEDQRFDPEADAVVLHSGPAAVSEEDAADRWLAVPVRAPAADGEIHGPVIAVLVAQRHGNRAAFNPHDQRVLEQLATAAAPHVLALVEGDATPELEVPQAAADLFRREALRDSLLGHESARDPLMLSPTWTRWSYRLLVAALGAALLFSLVFEVGEYARGIAVITLGGRTDLTAVAAGTAQAVEVEPGDAVSAGQVLVRFYEAGELAELERIDREIELHLINRLRFPADPASEQALLSLRAQRELATARLEERSLRAPVSGRISDLRVRAGQYLTPGQLLLSVLHEDSVPKAVILLPGEYRPLVQEGMRVRLEISGYNYAYQLLDVEQVSENVVGPNEARRYLSEGVADTVRVPGPVVLLEAALPSLTFQADGDIYQYHNGMLGTAEVRVRSEKILFTLVPGLKAALTFANGS